MTTYDSLVIADSPALYWRLGETSGITATDETVNGNDGTYAGNYTQGRSGAIRSDDDRCPGFSTSGTNSHVSVASPVTATTDVTMECWAHMATTSRKGCLMKNGTYQGSGTTTGNGYGVGVSNGDAWQTGGIKLVLLYENKRVINTGVDFRSGVGYEGWNHVVVVFDASGFPDCWLNGVLVAEPAFNDQFSAAGSFYCGGYNIAARAFQGEIDEVALYGSQLSQAQIEEHYEAGMAHWSIGLAMHEDV